MSPHPQPCRLSIEDSGHFVPDGALDLVRIPPGAAESFHVDLDPGQRLRFSIAADRTVNVRVQGPTPDNAPTSGNAVDLFHLTLRAEQQAASVVIAVDNPGRRPATVAVFLRTLPDAPAPPRRRERKQRAAVAAAAA